MIYSIVVVVTFVIKKHRDNHVLRVKWEFIYFINFLCFGEVSSLAHFFYFLIENQSTEYSIVLTDSILMLRDSSHGAVEL